MRLTIVAQVCSTVAGLTTWNSVSGSPGGYGLAYAEGVPGSGMKRVRAQCSPGDPANADGRIPRQGQPEAPGEFAEGVFQGLGPPWLGRSWGKGSG